MGNTTSTAQPTEDTQTQTHAKKAEDTPGAKTETRGPVAKAPPRKPAGLKDSIHAVVEHNATRDSQKQSPPPRAKPASPPARTPAAHTADAPNWALASPARADCTCPTPPGPAPGQKKRPPRPGKRERQERRDAMAAAAAAAVEAEEREREKEKERERERERVRVREERERERERERENERERERERERKRGGRRGRAANPKSTSGARNHPDAENIPPHDSDSDSSNEDRARARARRAPHEEQDVPEARGKKARRRRGTSRPRKEQEDGARERSSGKGEMQREACVPEGEEQDEEKEVGVLLGIVGESVEREQPPHIAAGNEDHRRALPVSDSGLCIGGGASSGDKNQKDEPAPVPAMEGSACCNPNCCAHGAAANKQPAVQKEPVTVPSQQAILLQLISAAPAPTGTPSAAGTPSTRVATNHSTPSTLGRGASQHFGFGSPSQPYTPPTANASPAHPASAPAALPTPAIAGLRERTPAAPAASPPHGLYAPNARDARQIAREYAQKQIVQAMQTPPSGAAGRFGTPLGPHNRAEAMRTPPVSAAKHAMPLAARNGATPVSAGKHNHALPPVSVNKLAHTPPAPRAPLSASAHSLARPVQAHVPARFGGVHSVRGAPVNTPGSVRAVGAPNVGRYAGQGLGMAQAGRQGLGWGREEGERLGVGEVGWAWGLGPKSVSSVGLGMGVIGQRGM